MPHNLLLRAVSLAVLACAVTVTVASRWTSKSFPVHEGGLVVVTGASSGLGLGTCAYLLRRRPHVRVMGTVRRAEDEARVRRAVAEAGGDASRLETAVLDVTDDAAVRALAARLARDKRRVVALVNNAGVSKRGPVEELDFEDVFRTNVFGLLQVTRAFVPLLAAAGPGARLVNVGSMAGLLWRPNDTAYAASKAAVERASDVMRLELYVKHGISVSLIEPGFLAPDSCKRAPCGDPSVHHEAVDHAVFSRFPKTRYPVGHVTESFPAWLAAWLVSALPDRVVDAAILDNAASE